MNSVVWLLLIAWLLPLASFATILLGGHRFSRLGWVAGLLATGSITASFLCSLAAAATWLWQNPPLMHAQSDHHEPLLNKPHNNLSPHPAAAEIPSAGSMRVLSGVDSFGNREGYFALKESDGRLNIAQRGELPYGTSRMAGGLPSSTLNRLNLQSHDRSAKSPPGAIVGDWYTVAEFGTLRITLGYYVDSLTILMMLMVTLVATCIHVYSFGYMREELQDVVEDPEARVDNSAQPLQRPGRFARFYQFLSLFCFSMLGLVLANNLFMIFVFWELVGICSFLLIGFYLERPSAVRAATKAFVVNRVGDFGMMVGLAALWGAGGTLAFAESSKDPGLFSRARTVYEQAVTSSAVAQEKPAKVQEPSAPPGPPGLPHRLSYTLLVLGGLGVFCGCVGKSAQFPLHVWLPDAMEGPTPVSALIHAATMVAAGVYLVARFYPVLMPEVLLFVAMVGLTSAVMAATMALVAGEIKRVLAFSTVSQLGFMMFALGIGGWVAGIFHLLTHAFFKALLFLGAGSVIHATGTGEISRLGGLCRKMPWTAVTMLVGCLAIAGAGIPLVVGLSGFHSKDAIFAQASLLALKGSPVGRLFLALAAVAAFLTAFYMFRLWYLTFVGPSRQSHLLAHAHESPAIMIYPLVILSIFAVAVGWKIPGVGWGIPEILEQARPGVGLSGIMWRWWVLPPEAESHLPYVHKVASWVAFAAGVSGFLLATMIYGLRLLDAARLRAACGWICYVLERRYFIDELYERVFVRAALLLAKSAAFADKVLIDGCAHTLARLTHRAALAEEAIDRRVVDAGFNTLGHHLFQLGLLMRRVQTGFLRQYLMLALVGTIIIFVLAHLF